jgi:hypothetical protein
MFLKRIVNATLAAAALAFPMPAAQAQGYLSLPINSPVVFAGGNPYYGFGYYGYGLPFAVTPYGVMPFNGFGYGFSPYGPYNDNPNAYVNPYGDVNGSYNGNYDQAYNNSDNTGNADANNADTNNADSGSWNFGSRVLPRTNDVIEATLEAGSRIFIQWHGEPRAVSRITFSLLDKGHTPLLQKTITGPPASARFTRTPRACYYQVTVEYLNGTTNTVISPL